MIAKVAVDVPGAALHESYDYAVPKGQVVHEGSRVSVPFGRRRVQGYVLELANSSDVPAGRLRELESIPDPLPILRKEDLELARHLGRTYRMPLSQAIRTLLPSKLRAGRSSLRKTNYVELALKPEELEHAYETLRKKDGTIRYPQQAEVLELLMSGPAGGLPVRDFPASSVRTLLKKGFIRIREEDAFSLWASVPPAEQDPDPVLETQQQAALRAILEGPGSAEGFLLHGVTGSGKTEVYIRLIREVLAQGKGAILLVPEISLTPQTYQYLHRRLHTEIALFHSQLSENERYAQWLRVRRGDVRVVLGPRSAILAPVDNLGAIIIDEEHETSYRSGRFPTYHAKEIAAYRAEKHKALLVLGSATPSVETYLEMEAGRWKLAEMPNRLHGTPLPTVEIVDMRREVSEGNKGLISGPLDEAIRETLARNEQVMLLLNRRGYASSLFCPACGHVPHCDQCDVTLAYHKQDGMLKCHYCGKRHRVPARCPECGGLMHRVGFGTQKLEEFLHASYPSARILRMDADTMGRRNAHRDAYERFLHGEADILVGTQMIAKGFDFSNVTLAAVVAADTMLHLPDFRSAERTFAQVTQLAGRPGRRTPGRVFVQTFTPDHYALVHASRHDYRGFYEEEIAYRRSTLLPPVGSHLLVRFTSSSEIRCRTAAKDFMSRMSHALGEHRDAIIKARASESPIRRLQGAFRYQVLLHLRDKSEEIEQILYELLDPSDRQVATTIEKDPNDLF